MVRPGSNVGLVLSEKQMENDKYENIHTHKRAHHFSQMEDSHLEQIDFV